MLWGEDMRERTCTVGIDIGTTSAKVLCLDENGLTITRAEEKLELIATEAGRAEQDPNHVYETVTTLFAAAVRTAAHKGFQTTLVGISAAMHSLIAIGSHNEPITNAILWLDGRAATEADAIWNSNDRFIYSETGTPIHAMSPLAKLMWIKNHSKSVFANAVRFASLKEWLWFKWFDEWCIDESMASATGLLHLKTRAWHEQALALTGIRAKQLSRIVPTTYIRAGIQDTILQTAGLTPETKFNIGASDGVLANLAHGVTHRGAMVLTIGTSLAIRTGSDTPLTDESLRPFCYILDNERFIVGAPSNNGGILLDWLSHEIFANEQLLTELCVTAEQVQADGLYCIPHVAGERAPIWQAEARASFCGLKLQHQQVHLMRAAIEGMLFNAYTIGKNLMELIGSPEYIIVSGKIFQNRWIRQFVADLFGIEVHFVEMMDASTIGAILLARGANEGNSIPDSHQTTKDEMHQSTTEEIQVSHVDCARHVEYIRRFEVYNQLFEVIHQVL